MTDPSTFGAEHRSGVVAPDNHPGVESKPGGVAEDELKCDSWDGPFMSDVEGFRHDEPQREPICTSREAPPRPSLP